MAKKKKQKEEDKKPFTYSSELKGLFLILIGLIGFGSFGLVGKIVKNFAIFLFGNWWAILLVLSVVLGIYMIVKRKNPDFGASRLIGMYSLLVALLLFSHINYVKVNHLDGLEIVKTTVDNIMVSVSNTELLRETGGGIIGSLFALLFVTLFDVTGTNIAVIVLIIFGIIMLLNVTISDILKGMKTKVDESKERKNQRKEEKLEEKARIKAKKAETPEIDDNIITINDIDEINNMEIDHETGEVTVSEANKNSNKPYVLPPIDLLVPSPMKNKKVNSNDFITSNSKIIEQTLRDFNITGKVVEIHEGPSITQYEVEVASGTKVSKVKSIHSELALSLRAKDIRIQAPIPGKSTIGIEAPNSVVAPVKIRDILSSIPRKQVNSKLLASLGKDIKGDNWLCEINKTPHLLVAGTTGSGKSVCINNIITSILMRCRPDEVKLVLVDPKKVELSMYEGIPHLMIPVVTDPKKASRALHKIVLEMESRYDLFSETGTKNIATYNEYIQKKYGKNSDKKLPFIVVIIDELADLMLVAGKEVEASILRITQMARAAGIHLIVATQRPSTDVITGVIKANIPSKISFAVATSIDSRTILGMSGAEKLLGKGDMLYLPMGENTPIRIQGAFIDDDEVKNVVDYCKKTGKAQYNESMMDLDNDNPSGSSKESSNIADDNDDPLFNEIVEFAIKTGKISASLIQRKYRLGYNRAARIIDTLEERGIIGGQNGSKPREVLVKLENKNEEESE